MGARVLIGHRLRFRGKIFSARFEGRSKPRHCLGSNVAGELSLVEHCCGSSVHCLGKAGVAGSNPARGSLIPALRAFGIRSVNGKGTCIG